MRNSLFHRYMKRFEIGFNLLMNSLKDNRKRLIQHYRKDTLNKKYPPLILSRISRSLMIRHVNMEQYKKKS